MAVVVEEEELSRGLGLMVEVRSPGGEPLKLCRALRQLVSKAGELLGLAIAVDHLH
jgi:hypothetical protein